jgi:hypothetical protein
MPYANPEAQREYFRRYYAEHGAKKRAQAKASSKRRRENDLATERRKVRDRMAKWRADNPERAQVANVRQHRSLRARLVAFLGGECERCQGSSGGKRLEIHHCNGDGPTHRKSTYNNTGTYREILRGLYPRSAIALLCSKCHHAEHPDAGDPGIP